MMASTYSTVPIYPIVPPATDGADSIPLGAPPSYEAAMRASQCEPQQTIKRRCTDSFYEYDLLKGTTLNKRKIAFAATMGILVGLVVIGVFGVTLALTGGAPLVIGLGTLGAAAFSAAVLGGFFGAVVSPSSEQHAIQVLEPRTDADWRALRDRAMARCKYNCKQVQKYSTERQEIDARIIKLKPQAREEELRNQCLLAARKGLHVLNSATYWLDGTYHYYFGNGSSSYPVRQNRWAIDATCPYPETYFAGKLKVEERALRRVIKEEQKYNQKTRDLCDRYQLNPEDFGVSRALARPVTPVDIGLCEFD